MTISPTTRLSAGPVDQVQPWVMHNGKLTDVGDAYGHTVYLGPPLGLPAISIPIGLDTAGLPLGIQLQARPGADAAKALPSLACLHAGTATGARVKLTHALCKTICIHHCVDNGNNW